MHRSGPRAGARVAILLAAAALGPVAAGERLEDLRGSELRIDADFRQAPLGQVLSELARRAGVALVLGAGVEPGARVDLVGRDLEIRRALDVLAREHCLDYRVRRRRRLIVERWSDLCDRPPFQSHTPGVDVPARRFTEPFEYPSGPLEAGREGRLLLRVGVSRYGMVDMVSLVRCDLKRRRRGPRGSDAETCAELYTAAARTLRRWRFDPPLAAGEPVEAELSVQVVYRIDGSGTGR